MAAAWLGALRIFQGETDEGLGLLSPLVTMGIGSWHSQPLTYAHMLRALGLRLPGPATGCAAGRRRLRRGDGAYRQPPFRRSRRQLPGLDPARHRGDRAGRRVQPAGARSVRGRPADRADVARPPRPGGRRTRSRPRRRDRRPSRRGRRRATPPPLAALAPPLARPSACTRGWPWRTARGTWPRRRQQARSSRRQSAAVRQLALAELLVAEIRLRRGDRRSRVVEASRASAAPRRARGLVDHRRPGRRGRVDAWRALAERRVADLASQAGPTGRPSKLPPRTGSARPSARATRTRMSARIGASRVPISAMASRQSRSRRLLL